MAVLLFSCKDRSVIGLTCKKVFSYTVTGNYESLILVRPKSFEIHLTLVSFLRCFPTKTK